MAGASVEGSTGHSLREVRTGQRKMTNSFPNKLNMRFPCGVHRELSISKFSEYVWHSENRSGLSR